MTKLANKTVLITGGASGIGKLLGQRCLEKKAARLVIWDINESELYKTAAEFQAKGWEVHPYQVDVSDLSQIRESVQDIKEKGLVVDVLFNNAGIVVGKDFLEHSHTDIEKTMEINASALMHIALELLPGMIEKKEGHIVNIASAAGMVSNPKMSVYCASKWAVIGWSDSLRLELEFKDIPVKVTTVTPYYISTGMFDGVRSPVIPIISPEKAVKYILRGVEKNRIFVRMPSIVYLLPLVKGMLPLRWFDTVVGKGMRVYKTMEKFKGRAKVGSH